MAVNSNSNVQMWDNMAEWYSSIELLNYQGGFSTALLANVQKPGSRVLEVGCGSGIGSEIVAMSLLSKQDSPVLVICDFSTNMIKMTSERFEQSDFKLINGQKVMIDHETDYVTSGERINLDQIVQEKGEFRKLVFGCRASGSALPFPDAWFTSYVSNLVLQLIDDQTAMIREAYRVLKPGSIAAFTVWGRRENNLLFTTREFAAQRQRQENGEPEPEQQAGASNFDFGRDIDQFVGVFREVGFKQVKHWHQFQNQNIRNGDEFLQFFESGNRNSPDDPMRNAIRDTYDERSGANTTALKNFEVMIILAYKD